MGRICQICGCERPNEQFGGRGQRASTCKRCLRRPKAERRLILATDEVRGFLDQSNISAKNIQRLEQLASINDEAFQELRQLVIDIARISPRRKRRWIRIRDQEPELFEHCLQFGLLDDCEPAVHPDEPDNAAVMWIDPADDDGIQDTSPSGEMFF